MVSVVHTKDPRRQSQVGAVDLKGCSTQQHGNPHPSVANWINTRLVSLLLFTGGLCSSQLLLALLEKDGKTCPQCAYKRAHNLPTNVLTSANKGAHNFPASMPTMCPSACPQRTMPTSVPTMCPPACPQCAHKRSHNESTSLPTMCPPAFPH